MKKVSRFLIFLFYFLVSFIFNVLYFSLILLFFYNLLNIIFFLLKGFLSDVKYLNNRDDSSSDDDHDRDSVTFILGGSFDETTNSPLAIQNVSTPGPSYSLIPLTPSVNSINTLRQTLIATPSPQLVHQGASFER